MTETLRSPIRLAVGETRLQLRLLRRNPVSVLFTIALPLLLLPLLDALQGGVEVQLPAASRPNAAGGVAGVDGRFPWMQYATPAIAAFAVVTACFANLAIRTAVARESGVLKRVRGTPLPPAAHLAGRLLSNALVALVVAAVTMAAGVAFYDVQVEANDVPVLALLVVLGAATFSALGLATTTIIPNADAAPAVVYALLFPLAFLSNVFYPPELAPGWMETTAKILPLGPFVSAMVGATTPTASGTGVVGGEVAAVAGWGVFGLTVALVAFGWSPRHERTVRRWTHAGRLRRLAIPLGVAVAVAGVLVPDVRPADDLDVGSVTQLAQDGIITTEVFVEAQNIEVDNPLVGAIPIPDGQGGLGAPLPFQVSILDRGKGPEALGFQGCGIESVDSVDAEWLAAVAPAAEAGAYVQSCNGAVYGADFGCVMGPCFGPLVMPTSVDGDTIRVRVEGTLEVSVAAGEGTPPIPEGRYKGSVTIGDDGPGVITAADLVADGNGIALIDSGNGWELRFASASPWLGTIEGIDVLGPPDRNDVVASIFSTRSIPFASVPTGAETSSVDGTTRFLTTQPKAGERILAFGPLDDADPIAPRGLILVKTTGPLLKWTTIEIDVQVDGSRRVRFDLERAK